MNKRKPIFLIIVFLHFFYISFSQVPATWTVNPAAFSYQMSVTAKANQACVNLTDPNNYIAAFVGGQCRGVVKTNTAFGPDMLGLLTIKSNTVSGEKVNFQIYNASTNSVVNVLDSIVFSQGSSVGTLNNPFMLYTNHVPTDIALSTFTVNENTPVSTSIATLSATDQDPATVFTYSLTGGQPENTQFGISGNNLTVNSLFDYETDSIKVIEIQVDDNGGCTFIKTFTIQVLNANDAPTALTLTTTTIFDHQQAGSYIGQFFTTDPDINDLFTYTLVAGTGDVDNFQFYVQNDTLYNASQVDYTTQSIYYIRARSTDLGGLFVENTFTLNVSNVNDAPTDIILSNNIISENLPSATFIGTLSVVDSDLADTHTLTLVPGAGSTDNALVSIIGNTLQTNASYNFEANDSLFIRIQASDPFNATYTKTFVIVVTDANDTPTNITLSGDSIQESLPVNTLIGTLISTDEDVADTHTYSLVAGVGDTDNALFTISNNQLLSNATYTFFSQQYSIRVQTSDAGGLTFEKVFLIKILNANDAPTDIIIDTLTIKEDNESMFYISKIRSVDVDVPDSFVYALVPGSGDEDNAEFTVTGDQLFINSKTNYDVKSTYNFRVKSTDLGGLSVEKSFVLQVEDIAGNSIPLPSTNYISPNGDGKNDFWKVDNIEVYKEFELKIFDQFGQIIYSVPNNYNNEFDGKYKGNALPTGNYYYIFQNGKVEYKGNITIVN